MNKLCLLFFIITCFSCSRPAYKNPHVLINTGVGDIEVELFPDKAPKTVAAFLFNVEEGLYSNTSFYRVVKADEMPTDFNSGIIQGGIYGSAAESTAKKKKVEHESTKISGLSHTDGTISLASVGAGTATTEFFICIGDQSFLDEGRGGTKDDQGFAAFGKVFKGMDIVRKIQNKNSVGDRFEKKINILRIEKL